LQLPHHK